MWKYSISRKCWLPLDPPQGIESDSGYTFIEYQSQLLMIGGSIQKQNKTSVFNRDIYELDMDSGWTLSKDICMLPENVKPEYRISAASEGNCLILILTERNRFALLLLESHDWKRVEGPKCNGYHGNPCATVLNGILYLQEYRRNLIHCVSLKSLTESSGRGHELWSSLPCVPGRKSGTSFSNFTVFDSSTIVVVASIQSANIAYLLAFEPYINIWMELGKLSFGTRQPPVILGLHSGGGLNGKLLVMGRIKDAKSNRCSPDLQFGILQITASG